MIRLIYPDKNYKSFKCVGFERKKMPPTNDPIPLWVFSSLIAAFVIVLTLLFFIIL